jgi:hypothetical protein
MTDPTRHETNPPALARVVVDPRSIVFRRSRLATGDVHLALGDDVFPAPGWNDFVVVIVTAFAASARALFAGAPEARVFFMEGPYAVDLRRGPDTWTVHLVETGARERIRAQAPVDGAAFVESILTACDAVLGASDAPPSGSRDTKALAVAAASLRDARGGPR